MAAFKPNQKYNPPFSVQVDPDHRPAGDNNTRYVSVDRESFPTSRDDFTGGLGAHKRSFRNQENENPKPDNASKFGTQ
jgi:hypothetical protein